MDNRYIDYFLILVACFLLFFYLPMEFGSTDHEVEFLTYIEKYNKSYEKGSDLYVERLAIFKVRRMHTMLLHACYVKQIVPQHGKSYPVLEIRPYSGPQWVRKILFLTFIFSSVWQ